MPMADIREEEGYIAWNAKDDRRAPTSRNYLRSIIRYFRRGFAIRPSSLSELAGGLSSPANGLGFLPRASRIASATQINKED